MPDMMRVYLGKGSVAVELRSGIPWRLGRSLRLVRSTRSVLWSFLFPRLILCSIARLCPCQHTFSTSVPRISSIGCSRSQWCLPNLEILGPCLSITHSVPRLKEPSNRSSPIGLISGVHRLLELEFFSPNFSANTLRHPQLYPISG